MKSNGHEENDNQKCIVGSWKQRTLAQAYNNLQCITKLQLCDKMKIEEKHRTWLEVF
jgi:hypothetical protein